MSVVYVVTMEGIYDHGCLGVFTDRNAAEAHARAHGDDSDGYHNYRIDEVVVDTPIWLAERGRSDESLVPGVRPVVLVEFVALEASS